MKRWCVALLGLNVACALFGAEWFVNPVRGDDAGDVVQLLPVFRVVPVADGIGQKFPVFFQGVVSAVEEVLDVVRHDAEPGSVPACLAGCRQGKRRHRWNHH